MKRMLMAFLVGAMAVSFCACTGGSTTDNPKISVTEATEEATKYSMNVDDYVYPEVKLSLPYTGSFMITGEKNIKNEKVENRMPQLSMDSADAKDINDDIHNKYKKLFDNMEKQGSDHPLGRTDYVCSLNDNILSIVIETRSVDTPNSAFNVYNINVETGKKLSADEVVALSSIDKAKAKEQLTAILKAKFSEAKKVASGMDSALAEAEARTLADENLNSVVYYFNKGRKLVAAYRFYWIAGAESYGEIVALDAEKTRG